MSQSADNSEKSAASTSSSAAHESKPKKKMCCVCPDTKKARDQCVLENGQDLCGKEIEAHKQCLRSEGFQRADYSAIQSQKMKRVGQIVGHLEDLKPRSSDVALQNALSPALDFPPCASDYFRLDDLLTEEERKIRYRVREFMEKEIAPLVVEAWEKAEFPPELPEKFKTLNLGGGEIKGYGCAGISAMANAIVTLEMARVDTSSSTFFMVHNKLAMASIASGGSEEQKQRLLPPMARLEKIGCFGLTEADYGSDASSLKTTATKVPGGWLINGSKRWIGNGTIASIIVVWARNLETGQVNGFVIEKGPQGVPGFSAKKIENKNSLRIVQNADLVFKDVFVPDHNKLANGDNFHSGVGKVLDESRIGVAWQPVGVAMGIFDHALRYAKSRQQFGVPIASFQLIQERLTRMLGTIQSMILLAWRTQVLYAEGKLTSGQSSMAKAHNTLRGREVAALGREILGGNGIVGDYHVARLFCDMESLYTYEGTYDINSLVTGREITGIAAFKSGKSTRSKH